MKKAVDIEGLKDNVLEMAKNFDSLFSDFKKNNLSSEFSIIFLNPDELNTDLEREKSKFIPINGGELLVALVKDDGSVVDLFSQR